MFGLGTVINVAAILAGGIIGLLGGKKLSERCQETLTLGMGVCTMFIGIAGALEKMLTIQDGTLTSGGSMMLVLSVALGGLVGEMLDLDGKMERFGVWLRKKSGNEKTTASWMPSSRPP